MFNLATCRKSLWNYGHGQIVYADASDADRALFDQRLAMVIERFFTLGTWRSMWKRINLKIYDQTLTLPRGFDTCVGCDPVDPDCGLPLLIYSRFHEFAAAGTGTICGNADACCNRGLFLKSDQAQTFRTPTGTYKLRAIATEVFATGIYLTGGLDENEDQLYETITLALASGTTTTTQEYTALPTIQKVVTAGPVSLYAVDTTTSIATLIAVYAPGETVPAYRQYSVPSATAEPDEGEEDVVTALCKLGLVLPVTDTDLVIPANMGALKLGLMSLNFEDKNDPERAGLFLGPNFPDVNAGKMYGAVDLLDAELAELSGSELPLFNAGLHYGAGSIPNVL